MRRIAAAASVADAPQGLFDLQRNLGAPQSLEALGMPFDGIAEAARLATENAYRNPREIRSEEHTSELQSLMRISYAVFCLKKKTHHDNYRHTIKHIQYTTPHTQKDNPHK